MKLETKSHISLENNNFCAKRSLRPTAEKDRDVIFVRPSVRIIIPFSCAASERVTGSAALWYFETKIFRNLKKEVR